MGMFPYECIECGGGDYRCGRGEDCENYPNCEGGQFCWENESYVLHNGKWINTSYDGYGRHESDEGKIYVPTELYDNDEHVKICNSCILCGSCYRKNKDKYTNKCIKQTKGKYVAKKPDGSFKRKGPPYPANECCGQDKEGNDGLMYKSVKNKKGVCTWKKIAKKKSPKKKPAKKSPKKKPAKKSPKKKPTKKSPKKKPAKKSPKKEKKVVKNKSPKQDFLQILEEHRKNCERQGKYVEAEIAKNHLEELKLHEENRQEKKVGDRVTALLYMNSIAGFPDKISKKLVQRIENIESSIQVINKQIVNIDEILINSGLNWIGVQKFLRKNRYNY